MKERHILVSTRFGPTTAHVYLARRERTAKDRLEGKGDLTYAANLLDEMLEEMSQRTGVPWLVPVMLSTELEPEDGREVQVIFKEAMRRSLVTIDPGAIPEALDNYQRGRQHFFIGAWLMDAANNPMSDKLMEMH